MNDAYRPGEPIPAVIPKVVLEDGEPIIATTHVLRPSPIPRWLAGLLVVLAALSVGYTVFQQEQRADDVRQMVEADAEAQARINEIIVELQRQNRVQDEERERLRTLVIALVESETEAEQLALLREYAAREEMS